MTPATATRILAPLDGSAESNAALPLARTLAKATGASVSLLRVLSSGDSEASQYARANLHRIAEELGASGLRVESLLRYGRPAEQIVEEILSAPTDMIVLRTHARVGIERALLGSVTQQVLTQTSVPMVLMRPGERRVSRIQKLLVPVDGSPAGAVAVGAAVALAHATGASIKLVQVAVPVAMQQTALMYEYGGIGYYDPAWDDDALASANVYVGGLVGRLRAQGLTVEGQAFTGPSVPEGICSTAEKEAMDLVLMSTHAFTGPARAVLGSVADAVVRTAPCPVLLIRREEGADEQPSPVTVTTSAATRGEPVRDRQGLPCSQ